MKIELISNVRPIFSAIMVGGLGQTDPSNLRSPPIRSDILGAAQALCGMIYSSMTSPSSTNARGTHRDDQVSTSGPTNSEIFRTKAFNLVDRSITSPFTTNSRNEPFLQHVPLGDRLLRVAAYSLFQPVSMEIGNQNQRDVSDGSTNQAKYHPNEIEQLQITVCLSIIQVVELANVNHGSKAAGMNDNDIRLIEEWIIGFGEFFCNRWPIERERFKEVSSNFFCIYVGS